MRLVSVAEMKILEETANAAGYTYAQMMKNAGIGIAHRIHGRFCGIEHKVVLGLVGAGNNGGDTLVALTELKKLGWEAHAMLFKKRGRDEVLLNEFLEQGGILLDAEANELSGLSGCTGGIIFDGVFGTGFRMPMDKTDAHNLKLVNAQLPSFTVVAVDCPSGVECESGKVSPDTLHASLTLCLEAVKMGLITPSALPLCGEIEVVDLMLSKYSLKPETDRVSVVGIEDIRKLIPTRDDFSHKGTYGKVMIAGGSVNYPGAPILAGKGAYAVGTGLVQTAVPEPVYLGAAASHLELTWLILDDEDGVIAESAADTLLEHAKNSSSIVLGPGIGREETTFRFIHELLFAAAGSGKSVSAGFIGVSNGKSKNEKRKLPPLVVDADALTLMARESQWAKKLKGKCVLTPHPGEMAALTGLSVDQIQADRVEIARKYAREWGQVVVLKGAMTVIAGGGDETAVIPVATSALAKAGSGDVLAGMIGGLLAQGLALRVAAVTGAWMHAQAGLQAGRMMGAPESVLASDVIRAIPEVYKIIYK